MNKCKLLIELVLRVGKDAKCKVIPGCLQWHSTVRTTIHNEYNFGENYQKLDNLV